MIVEPLVRDAAVLPPPDEFTPDQAYQIGLLRAGIDELATVPLPGSGRTLERWRFLMSVASRDLAQARLVEGHLDAVGILHELGRPDLAGSGRIWGVWAAEPHRLIAERVSPREWHLRGVKGWCSGSLGLDAALVVATAPDGPRLFVVDPLDLDADLDSWSPIGMAASASHTVSFDTHVPDDLAVGGPDAYVQRAGFWHGGAGVAACWAGGAEAVLDALAVRVVDGDPTASSTFGAALARLDAATALIERAAAELDAHPTDIGLAHRRTLAVRLAVEEAARHAIDVTNVALGARALCEDTPHSRRVADLTVYLRQLDMATSSAELARLAASERPRST